MAASQEYLDLIDSALGRAFVLAQEMKDLHMYKANAYSGPENPDTWANFRNAEDYGATPLQGCLIREADKTARLKNLLAHPEMPDNGETVVDTLIDRAAYNLIAVCLYREEHDSV